jgi:hypothetical protein
MHGRNRMAMWRVYWSGKESRVRAESINEAINGTWNVRTAISGRSVDGQRAGLHLNFVTLS